MSNAVRVVINRTRRYASVRQEKNPRREEKEMENRKRSLKQSSLTKVGEEFMYATTTIENVPAATLRTGARRSHHSSVNYIVAGIRTLMAATALAFAAAGTALAGQALWVANGANVVEFANLPSGAHDEKPRVQLNSGVFGAPQGVVFDASNNLWVIDGGTVIAGGTIPPSLEEFTEAQLKNLKKDPAPMPNVQITSNELTFPQQAVFDASGNMWLSDNGGNIVYILTPTQLAAGGDIQFTNAIVAKPSFNGPLGIVLHDGNLYVANNAATTIYEFNANHLPPISNAPLNLNELEDTAPDVILSDDGNGSIQGPWALVFDQAGDLWSSNANAPFTLVAFGPAQITMTGDPTPEKTISPFEVKVGKNMQDESLAAPNGIAFDQKGNLVAISSASPFGVARYDSKDQMTGGSIKPDSFLAGANTTLNAPAGDNFGPEINH
jgi:DNA-binding beta-propeller fold protein YncE